MPWIVVVPCYNKGAWLRENCERTAKLLEPFGPSAVIIVDNGSTDSTSAEVARLPERIANTRIVKLRLERRGLGIAFRAAVEAFPWRSGWTVLGSKTVSFNEAMWRHRTASGKSHCRG